MPLASCSRSRRFSVLKKSPTLFATRAAILGEDARYDTRKAPGRLALHPRSRPMVISWRITSRTSSLVRFFRSPGYRFNSWIRLHRRSRLSTCCLS